MTTFRSKILLLALIAAFGLGSVVLATAAETTYSPEKLKLAKEYVAAMPLEDDVKTGVNQLAEMIAPDQRVLFRSLAASSIDYDRLRAAAELATAEIFTEDEIKAMTAFFSTPQGQSVRAKMPQYEARIQPIMMDVLKDFVTKLQENNITLRAE